MDRRGCFLGALGLAALPRLVQASDVMTSPLIIAHRGASGLLPEHTLESYRLALELGADVIEPDLVFTKDGHLVCRHEHYLSGSTNIAGIAEFAARKTQKPGHDGEDWFTEDFTLAELKTLRARQAFPGRSRAFDDRYQIPTLADVLALAQSYCTPVRLYPEPKQPRYFAGLGYDFKAALTPFVDAAAQGKIGSSFLQCFEPDFTQSLPEMENVSRIQLIGWNFDLTAETLQQIAAFAEGIGPHKSALLNESGKTTGVCEAAQQLGLKVHPYTFRTDQFSKPFTSPIDEYFAFFDLGIDGLFTDFTQDARLALKLWQAR